MGTEMPPLETERLIIRPFRMEDLQDLHRILDVELEPESTDHAATLAARRQWLEWAVLNYTALGSMYQPPYGDRAVTLRATGALIGACGFAPVLAPLGQLPAYGGPSDDPAARRSVSEFGLYWAISPAHQRRGYAAEAGQALIDYGFAVLNLRRIVATTDYDNLASQGVMRKLGMRVERNPYPDPPWLQIVATLDQA